MSHPVRLDAQRLSHAAAVIDERVATGVQPCAVAAVANSAETLWTHVAPGQDGAALDSIFLLASITKPITATAVMQLVEEGRLLLHVPVASYLPAFSDGLKAGITAAHLLTHTSGLDETAWSASRLAGGADTRSSFEQACAAPVLFEPGSRCAYCTLSFEVLAELVRRLSGKPFGQCLSERVFGPAGMADTAFWPADAARRMPVHDFGGPEQWEMFGRQEVAGGGLWSTAADLVRFGQAYLRSHRGERGLVGPAACACMTRDVTAHLHQMVEGRPAPFHYGLGWGVPVPGEAVLCSPRAHEHGGASGTLLWVDPAWDLVYVFLTNRWGVEGETPRRVLNAVYGALTGEGLR